MTDVFARLHEVWAEAARAGVPLPSEKDLATMFGVSRPTVREALVRLEAQGLVRRHPHQGTFPNVAALDLDLRIDQSFEFADAIRRAGRTPTVQLISSGWGEVDEDTAARTSLGLGTPTFSTTKRWCADNVPIMYAVDHIPMPHGSTFVPDALASVFQIVRDLRGATVEWESARLRATLAGPDDRRILEVDEGRPLLSLDITGVSRHGDLLYVAFETHRDDVLPYWMVRSAR